MTTRDAFDDLPPEDADAALAAEYVLRLLGDAENAACAAREATDPTFAAAVARWRTEFAPLDATYVAAPPPGGTIDRIEARLFGARPSLLARLWGNAGLWRGFAAAATIVALWFALPVAPPPGEPAAQLVSALAPAASPTEYLAVYAPQDGALRLNRVAGEAPAGRSLELWVIAGEAAPVSLGVLPEAPMAELRLPAELAALVEAGAVLAVTDEPPGGAPGGVPTGQVQAAGPLREI